MKKFSTIELAMSIIIQTAFDFLTISLLIMSLLNSIHLLLWTDTMIE
ncbi:hypothetical protein [Lederbergia lenta]|nr:hypothetical protein [Lederbergia lenta]